MSSLFPTFADDLSADAISICLFCCSSSVWYCLTILSVLLPLCDIFLKFWVRFLPLFVIQSLVPCRFVERRRCTGAGQRCARAGASTHIITFFCERVLMFCHSHEALTTPSPLPGQASARRVAAPLESTARADQGRGLLCHPRDHHAAERRRSLATIAAGLGSGSKLTRHVTVSDLLSLCLSQYPQVGRRRCNRARLMRADVAAWSSCCRLECCKRSLQDMIVCAFSAGDGSVWAAALSQLLRSSQDTPHSRRLSGVCRFFVMTAVCSMACSVLTRFTTFWIFSRRIPDAVCFSLFHSKAMTLLTVPHALLECVHFPSPASRVFFCVGVRPGWEEQEKWVGSRFAACMWIYTKAVICNGQENTQEKDFDPSWKG